MWQPQPDLDFSSKDGSLRIEQRLERWSDGHPGAVYGRRLIVRETAGDALLDAREWQVVEAIDRMDGAIDLRFSLFFEGSDVLFRIDPAAKSFRDVGMNGDVRPLRELQAASDTAHREIEAFTAWHYDSYARRYVSRDGRLRVEVHRNEPDRAQASSFTTIFDTETGQQIADLEEPNWSSWLQPMRDEITGLGKLSVNHSENFAWIDFVLEPATMRFRADQDHRESKPISELPVAIASGLKAAAVKRTTEPAAQAGWLDKSLIFVSGLALGVFAGFMAFGLYGEFEDPEPAPVLATVPRMTPLGSRP